MKRVALTALTFVAGVFFVSSLTVEGVVFGLPLVVLAIASVVPDLSQRVWEWVWRTA
ncbi:hypothetical protein [Halogranum gelatinilyticum]|nr:hypothetical protein [Halogranum gelatinilyticum]